MDEVSLPLSPPLPVVYVLLSTAPVSTGAVEIKCLFDVLIGETVHAHVRTSVLPNRFSTWISDDIAIKLVVA